MTKPTSSSYSLLTELIEVKHHKIQQIVTATNLSEKTLKRVLAGETYQLQPSNFYKLLIYYCQSLQQNDDE